MLKFFYRLKRQRGIVLFVVIAFMALLIAMATTAYFTARASYKTVVSNYDFSQLYLSTTSVSDMLIGALTQSTTNSTANNFKGIKDAVATMKTDATTKFDGHSDMSALKTAKSASTTKELFEKTPSGDRADLIKKIADISDKVVEDVDSIVGTTVHINSVKGEKVDKILQSAAEDPVAGGLLDAAQVKISLVKIDYELDVSNLPTGRYIYYFTLNTIGYYRNNYVAVQDMVYNISGTTSSSGPAFNTYLKNTGGSEKDNKGTRVVIIGTDHISDNVYFENKITVIHKLDGGINSFDGSLMTAGDLFFCESATYHIPRPGYTWGSDGVTEVKASDADIAAGRYPRHDWFINGDLGFIDANAGAVNMNGNNLYVNGDLIIANNKQIRANNVYVTGNIYFTGSGAGIILTDENGKAADESGCTKANVGAVYCNGEIKCGVPSSINVTKDSTTMTLESYWNSIKTKADNTLKEFFNDKSICGISGDSNLANINGKTVDGVTYGKVFVNKTSNISIGTTKSTAGNGTVDWANLQVTVSKIDKNSAGDGYEFQTVADQTISDVFNEDKGMTATNDWNSYTAKEQATMDNTLTIDMTNAYNSWDEALQRQWTEAGEVWKKTVPGSYEDEAGNIHVPFDTANGTKGYAVKTVDGKIEYRFYLKGDKDSSVYAKVYADGSKTYVDIPYNEKGYTLTYIPTNLNKAGGDPQNNFTTITLGVEDNKTMPVVLTGNFNDGTSTGKDKNGFNAFSWTGGEDGGKAYESNGGVGVQLAKMTANATKTIGSSNYTLADAKGNIAFEMGNLDCDSSNANGEYILYDSSKVDDVVTLRMGKNTFIGTKQQLEKVTGTPPSRSGIGNEAKLRTLLNTGNDPKSDYDNRVMVISNKNTGSVADSPDKSKTRAGVVFDNSQYATICGYIYAPNAVFAAPFYQTSDVPVFGGMIVAESITSKACFLYAEPDPRIISNILDSLHKDGDTSKSTPAEGYWYLDGAGVGKNYLG